MSVYVVEIDGQEVELPGEWVLPWTYGVADCVAGRRAVLAQLELDKPDDTVRMHALQIGHRYGWFTYKLVRRDT